MLFVVLLGIAAGMRTMTPIAVVCWCARLGLLPLSGWESVAGSLPVVILLTVAALAEYVVDLLPKTPSRTDPPLLISRLVMGAAAGALAWHALMEPVAGGVLMGAIGALIGTFAGHKVRVTLGRWVGRDWPIGVLESALALAFALVSAHALHHSLVKPAVALLHVVRGGVIFG
jgi:uncharacterized membrane protein